MKKTLAILGLFLILISFISCSNSYDSILDQFNRKYFSAEPAKEEPYSVKSSKFVASEMLSATYTVPENVYLNLELRIMLILIYGPTKKRMVLQSY